MCQTTSCTFKDQGNAEYKKGNWLKAAGLYTKGIKKDPDCAVLYSNRSAALLQLKKAAKALDDAEECIRRRPEWEKGYFRKGLALELQGAYKEALEAVEAALKCNPQNVEMAKKSRELRKLRDSSKIHSRKNKENQDENKPLREDSSSSIKTQRNNQSETAAQGARQLHQPGQSSADTAEFQRECLALAIETELLEPSVYFLGPPSTDVESSMSQVKIKEAFQSPDLLQNCIGFLRQYASENGARAACAVVPLKDIAFPQVWKQRGWPLGDVKGALVQLETPKERRLEFLPADGQDASYAVPLSEDFKILEPLFR